MKQACMYLLIVAAAGLCACPAKKESGDMKPLDVVASVDLSKYMGTWYEIARYPNRFQEGCYATQVTYSLRPDGKVKVVNSCREGSPDGKEKSIEGTAWSADPATNAKLKVRFFWPFSGDYWIIQLDPDYRYAVVGHPSRTYLWILSRTPALDPQTLQALEKRLVEQGYDPSRLIRG